MTPKEFIEHADKVQKALQVRGNLEHVMLAHELLTAKYKNLNKLEKRLAVAIGVINDKMKEAASKSSVNSINVN